MMIRLSKDNAVNTDHVVRVGMGGYDNALVIHTSSGYLQVSKEDAKEIGTTVEDLFAKIESTINADHEARHDYWRNMSHASF